MWRKISLNLAALGLLAASVLSAGKVTITNLGADPSGVFSGAFTADDQYQVYDFSMSPVNGNTGYEKFFFTTGFGGTSSSPGGGFQPILSLFAGTSSDPNSWLVASDLTGGFPDPMSPSGCTNPNIFVDVTTGFCLDSFMDLTLKSGNYVLVVSEAYNTNYTGTLGNVTSVGADALQGIDSFSKDGQGNFSGNGLAPGGCDTGSDPFHLDTQDCRVRTGDFTVVITPEPSTIWLFAAGSLFIGFRFLNNRKKTQSQAK